MNNHQDWCQEAAEQRHHWWLYKGLMTRNVDQECFGLEINYYYFKM